MDQAAVPLAVALHDTALRSLAAHHLTADPQASSMPPADAAAVDVA